MIYLVVIPSYTHIRCMELAIADTTTSIIMKGIIKIFVHTAISN